MADGAEEVYRRRKNSRVDNGQRVIGGLGRRRVSEQSAGFKDRLQQFANTNGDNQNPVNNNATTSTTNPLSPATSRRRGDGLSTPTRRVSVGEASPMPRRRKLSTTSQNSEDSKSSDTKVSLRPTVSNNTTSSTDASPMTRRRRTSITAVNSEERTTANITSPMARRRRTSLTTENSGENTNLPANSAAASPMMRRRRSSVTGTKTDSVSAESSPSTKSIPNDWRAELKNRKETENNNKTESASKNNAITKQQSISKTNTFEKSQSNKTENKDKSAPPAVKRKQFGTNRTMSSVESSALRRKQYSNSPMSSFDSVSKVSSIKSRLYDVNNNDAESNKTNDSSDNTETQETLKRTSRWKEKTATNRIATSNSPRSSVENISKWNTVRNKFADDKDKTSQVETTPSSSWRRETNNLKHSNEHLHRKTDEKLFKPSNNLDIKTSTMTNKHLTKSTGDKSTASNNQNNIEISVSSPGLTRRTIQSQNKLTSGLDASKSDYNSKHHQNSKEVNINRDVKPSKNLKNKNIVTERNNDGFNSNNMIDSSTRILQNDKGVKSVERRIHAETFLTNQNEPSHHPHHRSRGVFTEKTDIESKTYSTKTHVKNGFSEQELDKSIVDSSISGVINENNSYSSTNYAKLPKQFESRLQTRDRSNTWTTTDSDEENKCNSDKNTLVRTDSSDSTGEKEPNRRRRLTKKRSSRRTQNKPKIIPRNKNSQHDTSDGDILESNYTSEDCMPLNKPDTDINSDADVLESKQNTSYISAANKNTEILTSQSSELKDNSTLDSSFHNKKEALEKLTEQILKRSYDVDAMKSSSMTAVTGLQNLTSFSTNDMGGSRSEDEGAKLSNWNYKKIKDGPSGSFTSIAKVSAHKLKSFPATPGLFSSLTKTRTSSEDKPSASYSELPSMENGITTNPFVLSRSRTFGGGEGGRFSDGDQELTSRIEKNEQEPSPFKRSATLPRNMTFRKGIDIRKSPFSMAVKTAKEQEESERDAEILKNLPSSPFALLGRFARDTQKMQSRSTGSLDESNFTEIEKDINYEADAIEISPELNEMPSHIDVLNNNILNSIKDQENQDHITSNHIIISTKDSDSNIKDNSKLNSKVVSRPTALNLSLNNNENELVNDDDYYKYIVESPAPRRRPSYIRAQNSDDIEDPMSSLVSISKEDEQNDNLKTKKRGSRSRPQLPGMLTKESEEREDENLLTKAKEQQDSDSDEPPLSDFKSEIEKVETLNKARARPRPPLAQQPFLAGIPEEKGGKDDQGRKRRLRRPVLANVFPEATIAEEPSREPDCDSPKTADERETGYHSQGSDFQLSTPKELSIEDLSENDYDAKTPDETQTKNNSIPAVMSGEDARLIDNTNSNSKTSSSEVNLNETKPSTTSTSSISEHTRGLSVTSNDGSSVISEIPDTPVSPTPPQDDEKDKPKPPPTKKKTPKAEMRRHVLQNLLDTERSYVTNLGTMLSMFMKPLKRPENSHIIESSLVDEIFFQIPEILVYHESFLEQLTNRVNAWHDLQIIGDIFVSSFTKNLLMDAYSTFITHFVQAKSSIRQATTARPQFVKYIEQCTKEHREKLTLSDLLIMPVQRIPRYVLILKDMLKYTPLDHPDYGNLQLALGECKTLADRMNKGEVEADQAERDVERVRDIEATIEGISDLVSINRKFIRQDLVAEMKGSITKKDRCLFLFSDLLVCTSVRRKPHALRRGSLGLFTGQSAAELNRYKFLWKLTLDDVEISKADSHQSNNGAKEIEQLKEDMKTMNQLLLLSDNISVAHQNIEMAIKELLTDVQNQIQDKQVQSPQLSAPAMHSKIEFLAQTEEGPEYFTFIFLSGECKTSWEAYFEDAKHKLAYSRDTFPPEFQLQLPITKTRSGMQFTCAAPSIVNGFNEINQGNTVGDVWVCNSDGYVGQVCLISMVPGAKPKACLSVCSAKIVCVAAVPGARLNSGKAGDLDNERHTKSPFETSNKRSSGKKKKKSVPTVPSESEDDDMGTGAENIMAFDSSDDEGDNMGGAMSPYLGLCDVLQEKNLFTSKFMYISRNATYIMENQPSSKGGSSFGGRMSPDGSSLGSVDSMENDSSDFSSDEDQIDSTRRVSAPGSAFARGANGYTLKGGLDELLDENLDEQATMWLGTEDGHIYVFHAQDAIIHRKSKMKMQLAASVTAILYFENKVFVALGSGELCIYKRSAENNAWMISTPQTIHVSITGSAIICMTAVAGRIWCGCQNTVVLVNASSLKLETTITVSPDHNKSVHKIVSSGLGVWVSVQSSATIRLYHATTYENLVDVDVAPAVHKMLASADAIIRQHKAACLRVTSLLICKDLLWIGTSAGVILTNPLPSITASTSVLRQSPGPTGSPHGHTGHVRFLTSVDVPKHMFKGVENASPLIANSNSTHKLKSQDSKTDDTSATVTLVVSGGDGCEDFRNTQQNESVGRDDSTNHLLLWRV